MPVSQVKKTESRKQQSSKWSWFHTRIAIALESDVFINSESKVKISLWPVKRYTFKSKMLLDQIYHLFANKTHGDRKTWSELPFNIRKAARFKHWKTVQSRTLAPSSLKLIFTKIDDLSESQSKHRYFIRASTFESNFWTNTFSFWI